MKILNDRYGQVNRPSGCISKLNDNFWKKYTSKDVYEWNQYNINHNYTWNKYNPTVSGSMTSIYTPPVIVGGTTTSYSYVGEPLFINNKATSLAIIEGSSGDTESYFAIINSDNGYNWTMLSSGQRYSSNTKYFGIVAFNNKYYIPAVSLESSDGITWSTMTTWAALNFPDNCTGIISHNNELTAIIQASFLNNESTTKIKTSTDGNNWTIIQEFADNYIYDLLYLNDTYILVGYLLNGDDRNEWKILTRASNTSTFIEKLHGYNGILYDLCYSAKTDCFYAVGSHYQSSTVTKYTVEKFTSTFSSYDTILSDASGSYSSIGAIACSNEIIFGHGCRNGFINAVSIYNNSGDFIQSTSEIGRGQGFLGKIYYIDQYHLFILPDCHSVLSVSLYHNSTVLATISDSNISAYPIDNQGYNDRYWYTYTGDNTTKGSLLGIITSNSSSSYPNDGISGDYWYTYNRTYKSPDAYLDTVGSINSSTYPTNGVASDGYYYIKQ
jgi:hypothetical protein